MSLDHDGFGVNQSKIMNLTGSKSLGRDAGGKPFPLFINPALEKLRDIFELGHPTRF
jgi:hypothetical protein